MAGLDCGEREQCGGGPVCTMTIKWIVEEYDMLGSTQDTLKELASERPEGFAVQARKQQAGKGRQGREWISPEGNLYLSVLLKPTRIEAAHAGQLSFVAALAVAKTVASYLKDGLMLKWPNDVLLDGKKCAGILLETDVKDGRLRWVSVGVG